MLRWWGLLLLWLGAALPLASQSGSRQVYDFLLLPTQAQVAALGGHGVALMGSNPSLAWHNPALLSDSLVRTPSLQVVNYLADITYGNLAYAQSLAAVGYWHAGVHYANFGRFTRTDDYGNTTGSFSANELAVYGGVARHFGPFRFGSTIKFVYSNLAGLSSSGLAIDFGGLYVDARRGICFGIVLRNVGIQLSTYEASGLREQLPLQAEVGFSHRLPRAPLRYHITLTNLQSSQAPGTEGQLGLLQNIGRRVVLGAEVLASRHFTIRLGYNAARRAELATQGQGLALSGISLGFGLRTARLSWDYAYANYHAAASSHHFGLSYRLRRSE